MDRKPPDNSAEKRLFLRSNRLFPPGTGKWNSGAQATVFARFPTRGARVSARGRLFLDRIPGKFPVNRKLTPNPREQRPRAPKARRYRKRPV